MKERGRETVTVWPNFGEIRFRSILELRRVGQVEEIDVLEECMVLSDSGAAGMLHSLVAPPLHHHSLHMGDRNR